MQIGKAFQMPCIAVTVGKKVAHVGAQHLGAFTWEWGVLSKYWLLGGLLDAVSTSYI